MIQAGSRYMDATVYPNQDQGTVTVQRRFPKKKTERFVLYTWNASDRIDAVASRFLGAPDKWWKIMDANPLVQNVHDITPGEQIRIPSGA
jgi:hypothetical protein